MNENNKFLFDLNNFDAQRIEEASNIDLTEPEEELPPPPPTFSEDELESAKIMAHEKGRQEGFTEERQSREEKIKTVLENIAKNFSDVFASEHYRERQYEEESLKLSLAVLDALAPTLEKHLGRETIQKIITENIKKQSKSAEIVIEVSADNLLSINDAIGDIWADDEDAPKYKIIENSELDQGACNIQWQDGGVIRNPERTAEMIKTEIETLLNNLSSDEKSLNDAENTQETKEKVNSTITDGENNGIKNQEINLSDDKLDKTPLENTAELDNTKD